MQSLTLIPAAWSKTMAVKTKLWVKGLKAETEHSGSMMLAQRCTWSLLRGTNSALCVQLLPSNFWCTGARAAKGGSSTKLSGQLYCMQHVCFPFLSMLLHHFSFKQAFSASCLVCAGS